MAGEWLMKAKSLVGEVLALIFEAILAACSLNGDSAGVLVDDNDESTDLDPLAVWRTFSWYVVEGADEPTGNDEGRKAVGLFRVLSNEYEVSASVAEYDRIC